MNWAKLIDAQSEIALKTELEELARSSNWLLSENVLDVGSGTFSHISKIAECFPLKSYTCVEADERLYSLALTEALRSREESGTDIKFLNSDFFQLKEHMFDLAMMRLFAQHQRDKRRLASTLSSVLSNNASIIIIEACDEYHRANPKLSSIENFLGCLRESQGMKTSVSEEAQLLCDELAHFGFSVRAWKRLEIPVQTQAFKQTYKEIFLLTARVASEYFGFEPDFATMNRELSEWVLAAGSSARLGENYIELVR